ncbi:DUF4148 domain-containing protein [Paraburkholderia rhynchosiae]|uniref:DUF4148 domain-containing protein n=1 Tax=Paraburkholderia rhynchosiae TaxID=487049 RepID=A0A2N7W056_9BURK|nr:DUF4148 domain-containing protein [Paraburkholderia rhynchosiae]PMS22780.1 hypothetical protein C0Z16_32820 [Paraburkholderia rhynchosiae]CAB3741045.1 hypothetical protein LMG27174_06708 [Paraburkholderia rhynchosiae]
MNSRFKMTSVIALMMLSVSASAAEKLSVKECHSYPFVAAKAGITHGDLIRELSELESVGYEPARNDPRYPEELTRAEKRLHAKFVADCASASQASAKGSEDARASS